MSNKMVQSPTAQCTAYFNPTVGHPESVTGLGGASAALMYAWSPSLLQPLLLSVDSSGNLNVNSAGGGGSGAVTIADGADVTQGAVADAANTTGIAGTISGKLRGMVQLLATLNTAIGSPFQAGGSIANTSFGISGTLPAFAATPTFNLGTIGLAATAANQVTANTSLASILSILTTGPVPVSGAFYQTTQPISASSLPLPAGAAQETGGNLATIATNSGLAATSALQSTGNAFLSSIKTDTDTLASASALQATAALQTSVGNTAHTDAMTINTTLGSPMQETGGSVSITGTVPLPTNAAVETGGHLASIDLKNPSQGAATTANSTPVNIASDQTVPISAANDVFERQSAILCELLFEMRLMRQAFQDWSGQTDPRIDLSNDYTRGSATQLQ